MNRPKSIGELGLILVTEPAPGATTDYAAAQRLEAAIPNVMNAWTHVVPALAKYNRRRGTRSLFGRDKGEDAYRELLSKLRLVVLGLHGDGLLTVGADSAECLYEVVRTLAVFKEVYPNWKDAYLAGHRVFIEGAERIAPVLGTLQRSVETELYSRGDFVQGAQKPGTSNAQSVARDSPNSDDLQALDHLTPAQREALESAVENLAKLRARYLRQDLGWSPLLPRSVWYANLGAIDPEVVNEPAVAESLGSRSREVYRALKRLRDVERRLPSP